MAFIINKKNRDRIYVASEKNDGCGDISCKRGIINVSQKGEAL